MNSSPAQIPGWHPLTLRNPEPLHVSHLLAAPQQKARRGTPCSGLLVISLQACSNVTISRARIMCPIKWHRTKPLSLLGTQVTYLLARELFCIENKKDFRLPS